MQALMRDRERSPHLQLVKQEVETNLEEERRRNVLQILLDLVGSASDHAGAVGSMTLEHDLPLAVRREAERFMDEVFRAAEELRSTLGITEHEWREFRDR